MIITVQCDEILTEVAFFQDSGSMKIWWGQSLPTIIFLWLPYSLQKKKETTNKKTKQEKAKNRRKIIETCPNCPN